MNEQKKNKIILAILLLTPVFVMIAATITYKVGYVPEYKKNHGNLLTPPLEISQLQLTTPNGQTYDFHTDNKEYGRWYIFIFGDKDCADEACQKQLWETRQLHVALAHRAHYVQRLYVSIDGNPSQALQDNFEKEHTRLKWLSTSSSDYQNFIAANEDNFDPKNNHQFLLVDPNGWAMMHYNLAQHTGHDVMADLKYLLKKKGK